VKARDVMTRHPILVSAADREREGLLELMRDADIHHLPVVEDGLLLGVWVAGDDGQMLMLGPESVREVSSDADADAGMRALMGDAEVVLVRDAGLPVGVITRTDVLGIVRTAIGRGIGRRHPRPTVVRIAGRNGAGKTTLIMRSLGPLGRFDAVVVQANAPGEGEGGAPAPDAPDVSQVLEPSAHWRSGLDRVVARLADAELILVEDRDGELDLAHGIGEDVQVAVVAVEDLAGLRPDQLADAQAVVITRAEALSPEALDEAVAGLRARCPGLDVFRVGAVADDPGLAEWVRWISKQVMRRRG
jgi:CBS domain-containing protein